LLDEYGSEQQAASGRLEETAIADLPQIAAWRRAFTRFGAKATQHRNAAEALLGAHQPRARNEAFLLSPASPQAGESWGVEDAGR
jgi:DNA/RNA-binding domain of Phe-tRNA-synthetase-like protein